MQRPQDGLGSLRWRGRSLGEVRLLGVGVGSRSPFGLGQVADCYVRQQSLMAIYGPTPERPVETEVVWTVVPLAPGALAGVRIDLLISVRTELLRVDPALVVHSELIAEEVCRLAEGQWRSLPVWASSITATQPAAGHRGPGLSSEASSAEGDPGSITVLEPAGGPGCILVRLSSPGADYVEMVHPADFRQLRLQTGAAAPGRLRLEYPLFSGPLEKGVIVRARLRGILVDRAPPAQSAEMFQQFAAEEPPLSA